MHKLVENAFLGLALQPPALLELLYSVPAAFNSNSEGRNSMKISQYKCTTHYPDRDAHYLDNFLIV